MKRTLLFSKKNCFTFLLLFICFFAFSQSSQIFNNPANNGLAANTFTVPTGVTSIDIQAWGGGGAGGGATGTYSSAGGGAGGGYAKKTSFTVVPGQTYTVTVGAGGIGSKTSIVSGEASLVVRLGTTHLLAVGGSGANYENRDGYYTFGATAATTGNTGFTIPFSYYGGGGGRGYYGGGGGGSSAGTGSNGNSSVEMPGGAAVTGGGKGADGSDVNGNGANGQLPGGGGAGANALTKIDRSGGSGANGQVIISWACPVFSFNSAPTVSAVCSTNGAVVSVAGTALGLPLGTYTVTYNLSGTNTATGNTATMIVSTAGAGSFSTSALANSGNTTITITNLATSSCGNTITSNNAVTTTVGSTPSITTTNPNSRIGTGTVVLSAAASSGTVSWFTTATGGTAIVTANSYTTPSISATTTYYVQANNGSCSSSPRIAIVATINNPEIAVSGNSTTINDGDITPSTTDFTNLGSTNLLVGLTRTYTINNLGGAPLTIGTLTKTGTNAAEFVVSALPTTIPAQSSATFTITFTPTVTGTRTASISFVNGDADENPFNFDIAGTGLPGVTPEINIQGGSPLANILDGASAGSTANGTDFGAPLINTNVTKTFTIQNTGTGALTLSGTLRVVITGDAAFTVSAQPTSSNISSGNSITFQVTFNSAVTGNFLGIVSINNNDDDESVYDFVITSNANVNGVEIDIQGNDVSIVSGDTTPSTLDQTDFGITDATTAIKIPFQIYTFGTANLNLTSLTVTALTGTGFSVGTIANPTLPFVTGTTTNYTTSFVVTFTPSAALGVRTARITVASNDPNENPYIFVVQAEVKTFSALTTAPGGVTTNLKFWLKADSNIGTFSDNTNLSTWQEKTTSNTKDAKAKLGKEPKFLHNITNNVNFNPVIHFNGANAMTGGQGFNNLDIFVVLKPTNTINYQTSVMDTYCGDDVINNKPIQDVTGFTVGASSQRFTNEILSYNQAANTNYGVAETSTTKKYSGINIFNPNFNGLTRMGINNNGLLVSNTEKLSGPNYVSYKDIINSRYWLGASETFGPSYDGDILEVINYSVSNNTTDRRRIETYLAIKYGITLGTNGTSLDYYSSGSTNTATAIYPAGTTGAFYNYNIAGIGRDDVSQLYQKQSKTENTADDITIGLGNIYDKNSDNPNTFVGDKNYLVWGNDNGSLLARPAVVVNISSGITGLTSNVEFISVGRTWRVIESGGNVPSCKVSLPSTLLTSTITPPGDFLMFISNTPQFNPTSEYRIMRVNGSKLETDYDFEGTKYITFGYAPEKTFERAVDFDGVDDYLDSGKVLDINSSFTVSVWIKSSAINQTIVSKRNNPFTAGYDLSINASGKAEMSWYNGTKQSIISSVVMPMEKWHNVCVVYDNATSTAKLYIDGIEDASKTLLNVPLNPSQSFLIAAANGESPASFFNGTIDEVRVWDVALSDKQLRYVMNQEILSNGLNTNGSVITNTIPNNDINSIPWANLKAYYPMSTYTFTNAKDISNNNYTAALRNLTTVNLQTAPLPYTSKTDGAWQTASAWNNNEVQELPYSLSIVDDSQTIDWNIVKTTHNIISDGDKKVLGLYVGVGTSSTLQASNDSKIEVSHYLKLDGTIDLVGKSQLVQTEGSYLDPTSAGSIERDQEGQANKFNYNYWGSPVGTKNNTSNNNNFTVAGVLRDGKTATPQNITWVSGYNGSPTTPISLASYWIYKFDNLANDYANWTQIGENGILQAGLGFTLKGSGITGTQNLTFVGKPNNGTITNTVSPNQLLLVGNPYPSALDASAFISDNSGSIDTSAPTSTDGALYFWEHYPGNNTHNLGGYQGGYAVRNAAAGVPPSSSGVDFISPSGVSLRSAPNKYIPVGQGFFVIGNGTGGTVTFKNSQRAFVKEDNPASQLIYRIPTNPKVTDHWTDNSDDQIAKDTYKKVRLGFNNYNEIFHRQVVVAFMDDKANGEINEGYDAENIDDVANDMYLINSNKELIIEGEGYFDEEASFPIGVRSETTGKISFVLDGLENFDESQNIFIHDSETDTYHSIKDKAYEVEIPQGTFNERFSLRFIDKSLAVQDPLYDNAVTVFFTRTNNTLNIKNSANDNTVLTASLYNIQGKLLSKWDVKEKEQSNIKIPIQGKTSEVYIVKLKTEKGTISKKIIVK